MPALQVRDCPEPLYEELRLCAAEQDRSISQQTLYVLRRYLSWYRAVGRYEERQPEVLGAPFAEGKSREPRIVPLDREEQERQARIRKRKALFTQIEAHRKDWGDQPFPDAAQMIREMREERTDHILSCLSTWEGRNAS